MLIKACLNGARGADAHARLPVTPEALATDAAACAAVGAGAFHIHPRNAEGRESLHPDDVGAAVRAVRSACPELPVGVTTGAWIEPDPHRRTALIRSWSDLPASDQPDFASVNVSEAGWKQVATTLLDIGIGVEPGIWFADDPPRLAASGLAPLCTRILVEPLSSDPAAAIGTVETLLAALSPLAGEVPLLVHGQDAAAWPVLEWALDNDLDTRIGLEDTLELPDGLIAPDNAALVAAAFAYLTERH